MSSLSKFPNELSAWYEVVSDLAERGELKFKNATPHDVKVFDADGRNCLATIPQNHQYARVAISNKEGINVRIPNECGGGILPIGASLGGGPGNIMFLPPEEENTLIVVSRIVAEHAATIDRHDLIFPDTSDSSVVIGGGKVIGCRRFLRIVR